MAFIRKKCAYLGDTSHATIDLMEVLYTCVASCHSKKCGGILRESDVVNALQYGIPRMSWLQYGIHVCLGTLLYMSSSQVSRVNDFLSISLPLCRRAKERWGYARRERVRSGMRGWKSTSRQRKKAHIRAASMGQGLCCERKKRSSSLLQCLRAGLVVSCVLLLVSKSCCVYFSSED
jgi:hypothetical protein